MSLSVYSLIKELCASLAKECDGLNERKAQKTAFSTILFGNASKENKENCDENQNKSIANSENLLDELDFVRFEIFVKHRKQKDVLDYVDDEFNKYMEIFSQNEEELESITKLLLLLRNTDGITHYPSRNNFFQLSDFPKNCKANPYLPKFSRDKDSFLALSLDKFQDIQNNNEPNDCTFLSDTISSHINRKRSVPAILSTPASEIALNHKTNEEIILENFELYCERYLNHRKIINGVTNWEHLGIFSIFQEEPYLTECDAPNLSLHLLNAISGPRDGSFEAYLVPTNDFLWEVRYLNVGIQSNTFHLNDQIIFEMQKNVTIENVSPATMETVMQEFLECGSCYKRLEHMISKNLFNFRLLFDGSVYKAFCYTIDKFLANYRKTILNLEAASLAEFTIKTADMRRVLISLSKFLKLHPDVSGDGIFPTGSDFLAHLYKEIITVTKQDTRSLYIAILKSCCDVYFTSYQKWLFQGYLDDPDKELFIYYVDHYRPNTKYFFDKAYLIRKKSVPAFLQGFEDDILLCGKYTMLLKSFKPTHPLFSVDMLPITVCLLHEEIQELKLKCINFIKTARKKCGPPILVEEMLKEKQKKKVHFQKLAESNARKNLERWQSEQELRANELSIFKRQQLIDLKQQMMEIEERKLRQRLKSIELEKKCLEEAERLETEKLSQENENRVKRIEYYQELNRMIEIKKIQAEKIVNDLKTRFLDGEQDVADTVEPEIPQTNNEDHMAMSLTSDKFTPDEFLAVESENETSKSTESLEVQEDVVNESFKQEQEIKKLTMKKSQSDILNSNEIPSEFQMNKEKIMGSALTRILDQDDNMNPIVPPSTPDELTEAQKNKLKVLSHEFNFFEFPATGQEVDQGKPMTDAERNKLKVLTKEFGLEFDNQQKTPQIIVENLENLTDLQKNRRKILAHEFGIQEARDDSPGILSDPSSEFTRNRDKILGQTIFSEEFLNQREMTLNLGPETDRARNKRKVLQSEYNIVTNLPDYSPMSIGSDISDVRELKLKIDEPPTPEPRFGVPNTALINEKTPESGLNVDDKDGFIFPDPNESNRSYFEMNLTRNSLTNGFRSNQDEEMFKDFMDAILQVKPEFFKIPLDEEEEEQEQEFNAKQFLRKYEEIKSIDVAGITHHIQMSLLIPLNAHLEVLNNEILRMYLVDLDILAHFKSLRNYFFMMDGEFGTNICYGLQRKLELGVTPDELLNYHSLHMILSNALGSSIYGNDPNVDRLSFMVQNIPDNFELSSPNVLQMLSLSYKVEWPLNLILNPETLEQYANIFKYLVKVKRISWALSETFQILKDCNKTYGNDLSRSHEYRHIQFIRHKMAHFIQVLENHITRSAFQASWNRFLEDLKSAQCMEELYRKHASYLKRVLFLCLLNKNSAEYSKNVEEIFKVILKFHKYLKVGEWHRLETSNEFHHKKYFKLVESEKNFEKLIKYTLYLGEKIAKYNQQEIGECTYLININNYYTNKDS